MFKTLLCALALLVAQSAGAQNYPSQPIRMISPFPPGGSVDIMARLIAEPLGAQLGGNDRDRQPQRRLRQHRHGSRGARRPDGYTLVLNTIPLATNQALFDKLSWDPIKDFAPIGMVATAPHVLVVPGKIARSPGRGADQDGARQSRQAQLRFRRRRHHLPPVRRDVQGFDQHLHPACAVPRRRPGAARHPRRPGRHELPHAFGRAAARQGRRACARSR